MKLDQLDPFPEEGILRVVIETPQGSRHKYGYDAGLDAFTLIKTLPVGMAFPYDFGFVPRTRGDDGDPLDVLVLLPVPTFPGCVVDCRLVGVVRCTQRDPGSKVDRNDRFIAAGVTATEYAQVKTLHDLPKPMFAQLKDFFASYHKFEGAAFKVLGTAGPDVALRRLQAATRHGQPYAGGADSPNHDQKNL